MRSLFLPSLLALLAIIMLAGAIGGPNFPLDNLIVATLGLWRIDHPQSAMLVIWLTHLGGSFVLVPLTLLAVVVVWLGGNRRDALLLLATTFSGRVAIEVMKFLVDRHRPSFDPFPVYVSNQSFPSGHAGNSTVTYLALALFALPKQWRRPGLIGAMIMAVAIGSTRPILGVHWPSDVIGGWAFGVLWVWLWSRLSPRPNA